MASRSGVWGIETEVQQLVSSVARALPVTVAGVALWDEPSLTLTVTAVDSVRPVSLSMDVGVRVVFGGETGHWEAFERNEPVLLESSDGPGFGQESSLVLTPDARSVCVLPIRFAEETVGVLVLGEARSVGRESFSSEKQQRCRAIIEEFVSATAHAWEARRLRRQIRAMSSLVQLVHQMSTAHSYGDVLTGLAREVGDWLGIPARGALFDITGREVELLACWQLPDDLVSDGGRQMFLAMTRGGVRNADPVTVMSAGDDPLDPLVASDPTAVGWTRIAIPLMRDERLIGVACLYLEEKVRLHDWELDALRRRGDVVAVAVEAVGAAKAHEEEQECLHRIAFELLTGYRQALLREAFDGFGRALPMLLESHLRGAVPALVTPPASEEDPAGDRPDVVGAVVAQVSEGVSRLWGEIGEPESSTTSLDLNEIVVRALRIAKVSLGDLPSRRGVTVDVDFQRSATPLLIEGSFVLVGAIVHAIESVVDAMPRGGSVQIRTSRENGHAVMAVQDSGRDPASGTDELSRRPQIHQEIVLSVMRGIAQRHGGSVTVTPRSEHGNALRLSLPVSAGVVGG